MPGLPKGEQRTTCPETPCSRLLRGGSGFRIWGVGFRDECFGGLGGLGLCLV